MDSASMLRIVALPLVLCALLGCAQTGDLSAQTDVGCDDPLPAVRIVPPASDVAPEFGKYSGIWRGKWGDWHCSSLAVESIDKEGNALVVYSWGRGPNIRPGFEAHVARINDYELAFGEIFRFIFWVNDKSELLGRWRYGKQWSKITMNRAEPRAPAVVTVQAVAKCDDPFPDVRIVPPTSEVPPEVSKFSGIWRGKWNGWLCGSLAVESIDKEGKARVVYSWGPGRNFASGFLSRIGRISDGELVFGDDIFLKFTFWLSDRGELLGRRQFGDAGSAITMIRVE